MLLQDVAVKVFSKQEYSEEIITSFRQEVLCCTCFIMILKKLMLYLLYSEGVVDEKT